MQYIKKDQAGFILFISILFFHRKPKITNIIKYFNKMNKEMKLLPLHKQSIGIKDRCCQLLNRYFDYLDENNYDLLVYINFNFFNFFA